MEVHVTEATSCRGDQAFLDFKAFFLKGVSPPQLNENQIPCVPQRTNQAVTTLSWQIMEIAQQRTLFFSIFHSFFHMCSSMVSSSCDSSSVSTFRNPEKGSSGLNMKGDGGGYHSNVKIVEIKM